MTLGSRGLRLAFGLVLVAQLPSCGSGPTPPPPPTPPPTTLAPFVLFDGTFVGIQPLAFGSADINISAAGTLRVTMDWTFPSNAMHIYIMSGFDCTPEAFIRYADFGAATGCTAIAADTDSRTKPADFSVNVAQPTGARVYVDNLGPTAESGTVRITLAR